MKKLTMLLALCIIMTVCAGALADQMVTAIKAAVMRGEVRPGEALPSIRELAMLTGTSEKVPRLPFFCANVANI